jgi:uncharacterized protein YhhL (DUF1145 family)
LLSDEDAEVSYGCRRGRLSVQKEQGRLASVMPTPMATIFMIPAPRRPRALATNRAKSVVAIPMVPPFPARRTVAVAVFVVIVAAMSMAWMIILGPSTIAAGQSRSTRQRLVVLLVLHGRGRHAVDGEVMPVEGDRHWLESRRIRA